MHADLIARLEKLDGPDRETDSRIEIAVGLAVAKDGAGRARYADGRRDRVPKYTARLDVAVDLAKRLLPSVGWQVGEFPKIRAQIAVPVETEFGTAIGTRGDATAATPIIALCIAILKALSSSDSKR